jgi:hypothetical protein
VGEGKGERERVRRREGWEQWEISGREMGEKYREVVYHITLSGRTRTHAHTHIEGVYIS